MTFLDVVFLIVIPILIVFLLGVLCGVYLKADKC